MTDRVEKFLSEFESAIDAADRQRSTTRDVASAERAARQLLELLDRLAAGGVFPAAVPAEDIRSLADELGSVRAPVGLGPLIENGRALVTVIEDGIVDGDLDRLRAALARAEELGEPPRTRGEGQPRLAIPVRARCTTCDEVVVGKRRSASNWNAVTKELRDHERERHGGYSGEARDALRAALDRVRAGEEAVAAGRYVIEHG